MVAKDFRQGLNTLRAKNVTLVPSLGSAHLHIFDMQIGCKGIERIAPRRVFWS